MFLCCWGIHTQAQEVNEVTFLVQGDALLLVASLDLVHVLQVVLKLSSIPHFV